MKIVEAAQTLAKARPNLGMHCWFCGKYIEDGHVDDCSWLMMPQIVSVIETIGHWLERRNEILDGKNAEEGDGVRVVDAVAAHVLEKFYFAD